MILEKRVANRGHNEEKFKSAVLGLSQSSDWDEEKAKWTLHFVYVDYQDRECICEHSSIQIICVISNRKNANILEVGNVCVKRFLRLFSQRVLNATRKISSDITKSLNPISLQVFRERGAIDATEEQDYLEYWRKRTSLAEHQRNQKANINSRVSEYILTDSAILMQKASNTGVRFKRMV